MDTQARRCSTRRAFLLTTTFVEGWTERLTGAWLATSTWMEGGAAVAHLFAALAYQAEEVGRSFQDGTVHRVVSRRGRRRAGHRRGAGVYASSARLIGVDYVVEQAFDNMKRVAQLAKSRGIADVTP
jgi:hypothetical protein